MNLCSIEGSSIRDLRGCRLSHHRPLHVVWDTFVWLPPCAQLNPGATYLWMNPINMDSTPGGTTDADDQVTLGCWDDFTGVAELGLIHLLPLYIAIVAFHLEN